MTVSLGSEQTSAEVSRFAPVLTRLQENAIAHFGTADARLVPGAHEERPFSHLLRVGVYRNGASRPDLHLFVKLFKPKPDLDADRMRRRVEQDFELSRRLFAAFTAAGEGGVVRPVACYADQLAIVSEQADGVTLMAYLNRHARWLPSAAAQQASADTLAAVGRWLRSFQAIDQRTDRVATQDLRTYIDVRLQRLVSRGIYAAAFRERILQHLDQLATDVSDAELVDVLIHGDLAPGNILVSGSRVVVLDFAMVQRGCALHDISRLWVQLDILRAKPAFRSAVVERLQAALLERFDPRLTPDRPLFRYLLLLHRINHFSSLSFNREPLLARALSARVRRLHTAWIERELRTTARGTQGRA
jgi:hypothetical protein